MFGRRSAGFLINTAPDNTRRFSSRIVCIVNTCADIPSYDSLYFVDSLTSGRERDALVQLRRPLAALRGYRLRTYKTVSIVDDDASIRASTASLVRSMGWEARVYESADQFLGAIGVGGVGEIGCILCDIKMPGMTGLELLGKLRDDGYSFTIIFVTAYSSDKVDQEARAGGALCALEKPVDPTLLYDWLCRALDDGA